ncbi:MAG: NAD(P)H-hydrate dehydratase [Proteobacteria bacterium]|nr:NAD(P)H-hydrate dehydratase [Pseudomonadota bacterium]
MNLYSVAQTKIIEKNAMNTGCSGLLLMKRAGYRAFNIAQHSFTEVKRVYVLCGAGNNGGDGFAFAQYAYLAGWQVDVGLVVSPAQVKTSESVALLSELAALGLMPKPYDPQLCSQADLIVDALLGIGLAATLSSDMLSIIASINAFAKPVLALDVPSGLNADTGMHHGDAINAQRTVTFLTHKPGLISADGPDYAGIVNVESLDVPKEAFEAVRPVSKLLHVENAPKGLTARKKNAHKGLFGQALIVGGDEGMLGSVMLAAQTCAYAGAGVVRVVTHADYAPLVTLKCPEVMAYSDRNLTDLIERSSVVAVGFGLSNNAWSNNLWRQVLLSDKPKVVDAGALRMLASQPVFREDWVLTPHPGEAAALLGITTKAVQQDRLAAVVALQEKFGGVVVLKGNGTLVYDGTEAQICDFGDGAVSTAGMGDVLAGMIAALVAQGLSLNEAAVQGVMLHARAGERLAERNTVVMASELAAEVSHY